jgi:DNA-binding response OmpR family regulator
MVVSLDEISSDVMQNTRPFPSARLLLLATPRLRARLVADGLGRRGVGVEVAPSLDRLMEAATAGGPDAILLVPERLAGPHGIAAIRRLRAACSIPCVIVAAPEDTPADRVAALDAGADEVLHGGIPVPEAIARIRAALRRARPDAPARAEVAEFAPWRLVAAGRRLSEPGGPGHRLTSAEYELVAMLAAAHGAPVDREAISRQVFRRPWRPDDRAVDSLVKRLRRKLPSDAIHSVRGVGYVLTLAILDAPPPVENCALHPFGSAGRR